MARACLARGFAALAYAQPDPEQLRQLFAQNLTRAHQEFGDADARTAQAARDLAMFLERGGDRVATRTAYREALRLDGQSLGTSAPQTLEDAAALAAISPPAAAAPLWARASQSPDPSIAGPALSSLAQILQASGDRSGAAALLRRAVTQAEAAGGKDGEIVALVLRALAAAAPPEEAIASLRRALEIGRRTAGPRGENSVATARDLAAMLRRLGKVDEAAQIEREFSIGGRGR
jgi:tetratricopeptide (TPR) repeat protein